VVFAVARVDAGSLHWTWDLAAGGAVTCATAPVAAPTVRLVAAPALGGTPIVDDVACTLGASALGAVPKGEYVVSVILLDASREPLARVDLGTRTVSSGQTTDLGAVHFSMPASGGRLGFFWTLTSFGEAATCQAMTGTTVEATWTTSPGGARTVDTFTCTDYAATGRLLSPGSYAASFRLLDSSSGVLGAVAIQGTVTVTAQKETLLPNIIFALSR
jgi:hypothetical protein